jgi:hypothetical protein
VTTQVRNRGKGKSSDPFDEHNPEHVYIGRRDPWGRWEASKWANPFTKKHAATRGQAATLYREWLAGRDDFSDLPSVKQATPERRAALLAALPELKGKTLFCWCKPEACHGDVLAELAQGHARQNGHARK